jgi:2-aminoadipate transaminase
MLVELDRGSTVPLYMQICQQIRARVASGELAPGHRVPPERRLAAMLGVNRTTIVNAYRELAAEGLLVGQVGRGTVVADPHSEGDTGPDDTGRDGIPWAHLFTASTEVMNDTLLRDTTIVSARPDVISFATGVPSPDLYPIDEIRELLDEALHDAGQTLLQHSPTEGHPDLREALTAWMEWGVRPVTPENVVVVAGSQQGLYLLARSLLEPGDLVAVESPTYLGAMQVFRACGARLLPIPVDRFGMRVGLLEDLITRRRPKLIYTLPTFQNPTGAVMSEDRRRRLLAVAERERIPIIEDDPYGVLRYEGQSAPSLRALDESGTVIYLSTLSKVLFPGFRIGWVAAPQVVVKRLTQMKQIVDLDTNPLAQWAVWAFINRGYLARHVDRLRSAYPRRRDLMLAALEQHCAESLDWERPAGGFYIWARLLHDLRGRDLLPEAARHGVAIAPGESFHPDGEGEGTLRLNFTLPPEAEIETGIARLGSAIESLRQSRGRVETRRGQQVAAPIV